MPPVDASPVHWSLWQCSWFTGGTPPLVNLAVAEVGMCDSATVRDAGPWYLKDRLRATLAPRNPVDKRGTKCFDLQIPEHAQDPQPATAFLPARIRCTTFCEIPSEINRSMGNLLFWLGIGAAQKSAGSKVVKSTARQHQRLSIVVGILLALLISAGAFILLVSQQ
jgi:hypothetical protein